MYNRIILFSSAVFVFLLCSFDILTGAQGHKISIEDTSRMKVILDLDTGIDDAMALAYMLGNPSVEVIGITTVFGNVSRNKSVQNSLAILDLLGHPEIPVYAGADRPTNADKPYEADSFVKKIHGDNGVGNAVLAASKRSAEKMNAVDFIIESAKRYGKNLVLVPVGPETNLSELVKKDPDIGNEIGNITVMGGALMVEGNVNFLSEANIYNDPIAANDFFTSGTPFTMVGLDVTRRTQLTKEETKKWRALGTKSAIFYADMVDFYINYSVSRGERGASLHDPLAAAVSIHPGYVKTLNLPMKVDTTKAGWGRTIGITRKMNIPSQRTVKVAVGLDIDGFEEDFINTLTELFKKN